MIYITVRRWGEYLYLRTNDMLLPNAVRVAGIDDGEGETLFDRRGSTLSWVVPVDDTACFSLGWSDIDKDLVVPGRTGYPDRQSARGVYAVGAGDVGQTGDPAYEERQRAPGDWDAWVSQGPVTLHSHEHLGSTDRGVIMYRKLRAPGDPPWWPRAMRPRACTSRARASVPPTATTPWPGSRRSPTRRRTGACGSRSARGDQAHSRRRVFQGRGGLRRSPGASTRFGAPLPDREVLARAKALPQLGRGPRRHRISGGAPRRRRRA